MKTFKPAVLGFLPITTLILCGCSSVEVATHYDHTVPFGSYHTYAVEPPKDARALSPEADSALRASLRAKLSERGFREVSPNQNPDLAIVPQVKLERRYTVQPYADWGYGSYGMGAQPAGVYYGVWSGPPTLYKNIRSYNEGTLILDFVDASNQRLVFRGTGTADVGKYAEESAKMIDEAAKKIVAEFPASPPPPIAGNF
jgi:hypothetical protein